MGARKIEQMQARVDAAERVAREPNAIVGMGCRFPGGAVSPAAYWELLREGRDGTSDVSPDRWDAAAFFDEDPEVPGKTYSNRAGFLTGLDRFDPHFFGISPREAAGIDPQQRLVLEVAWRRSNTPGIGRQTCAARMRRLMESQHRLRSAMSMAGGRVDA